MYEALGVALELQDLEDLLISNPRQRLPIKARLVR